MTANFITMTYSILLTFLSLIFAISARHSISADSKICANVTVNEYELYEQLLRQQPNKDIAWLRPIENARKSINVDVRLALSRINNVVEHEGVVTLTFQLSLRWHDPYKVWNQSLPFACLDSILVPIKGHFIPDIALINSRRHYDIVQSEDVEKMRLYSNGTVSYRPGGTFDIFCKFDLNWFPFDEQSCFVQLETGRKHQTLSFMEPAIGTSYFVENDQWSLLQISTNKIIVQYLTEEEFDHLEFEIRIRRKATRYLINVIFPSIAISVAQFALFALPIGEIIKIQTSFICLLIYGTCFLMVTDGLPRSFDRIPLLSIYISISMASICLVVLGEGLVFACLRAGKGRRLVPDKVYKFAKYLVMTMGLKQSGCESENHFYISNRRPNRYRQNSQNSQTTILSNNNSFRQQKLLPTLEEEGADTDANFDCLLADSANQKSNNCSPTNGTTRKAIRLSLTDSGKSVPINEPVVLIRSPVNKIDTRIRKNSGNIDGNNTNNNNNSNNNRYSGYEETFPDAPSEGHFSLNKRKWYTVASALECLTLILYALFTILTPIFIFFIAPFLAKLESS